MPVPPKEKPKKWRAPKGPKPVHHKNKNTIGLGRAIQNVRAKENKIEYLPDGEMRFQTDKKEDDWVKLRSITHENSLDEFLNTAELANTDFTTERSNNIKIIQVGANLNPGSQDYFESTSNPYLLTKEQEEQIELLQIQNKSRLTVPRRPKWSSDISKYQLNTLESNLFLEWRRSLAILQNDNDNQLLLTPFEKNIEVWRQLWRVMERSDLIVQIVDARNPLFFRSVDLEKYTKELDPRKKNLLLVNKADLLTQNQRIEWARYFTENNIHFTFFSALNANQLLEKQQDLLNSNDQSPPLQDETHVKNHLQNTTNTTGPIQSSLKYNIEILTVDALEELFLKEAPKPLSPPPGNNETPKTVIGLVGYPNVGKSSTINALVGSKKVSVSATPGKTKHFQTIHLSSKVLLCDCPGLVFPNFAYTKGELVVNGVLPVDQLNEYTAPVQIVCNRIPKYFLELIYGIAIPIKSTAEGGSGVPTSHEFLTAYARARGYMTQGFGSADQSRAARYILKDYVNGKLLYVLPPPNENGTIKNDQVNNEFNKELYTNLNLLTESRKEQILAAIEKKGMKTEDFDMSKDLSKLTFSNFVGDGDSSKTMSNYGGKQAAIFSASDEIDNEFFKMNNIKGRYSTPFHKVNNQNAQENNKKHHKKNKKKNKNAARAEDFY
ncbi:ribosome biogenesis GTPase LSG1 [Ascoidea rubescens DSM 1968]|uniref:Putative GTPase n=1 Tax=Ascoidea rubescens DSM 1968 TaxID=1344418 RepID=A0A1D2VNT2_9ASCO|nr:putative GTPase [Ascoidea rubescens DSM 1968]ODV63227.1 putative GTPase [Ascoidea rubescens DSM 1968]